MFNLGEKNWVEIGKEDSTYVILTYTDKFEVLTYTEYINSVNNVNKEKLLEERIFNEDKEERNYRDCIGTENTFDVLIEDSDFKNSANPEDIYYYDDEQFLDIDLPRSKKQEDGYVCATGGGTYKFPIKSYKDLKVILRNYIGYDENGQAYIKAWRLKGFKEGKN